MTDASELDPVLRQLSQQMAHLVDRPAGLQHLRAAINTHARIGRNVMAHAALRDLGRGLAPAVTTHEPRIRDAMASWTRAQTRITHSPQLDTSVLARYLSATASPSADLMAAFQRLLDDAPGLPDDHAGQDDDVPEDLTATIAASVEDFAAQQPDGIPWETQQKLFISFWVTLVFLLLMQAQVEHPAIKELLEDAGGAALPVGGVTLAAAAAWKKMRPKPPQGDGEEPGTE